ncbi:MAG: class I SAM-dependent methyltransferase [Anaerolineae bacterium]|nr:class I SAM-dependent methyltransferase [Anaerolineae bacterium]
MLSLTTALLILLVTTAIVALLWWLLITTEGIYLGRGAVIWLYDLYARRYDDIKVYDPVTEDQYLARPILDSISHIRAPLVLDVATGTGRLPLALLQQPDFQGRVFALDLSRRMVGVAAEKLAPYRDRVTLLHDSAETLLFPDDTFDLVTCLEALEFMDHPRAVLDELVRVLRPGGLLVITNRQGTAARLMPGHTWGHDRLARILRDEHEMPIAEVQRWQVDYRLVWGMKAGMSQVTGPIPFAEVWRCPSCGAVDAVPVEAGWRCMTCETLIPQGADGVIEAWSAKQKSPNQR